MGGGEAIPVIDPEKKQAILDSMPGAPAAGVFELGLVLGGTVSAGAYTAGALDLLVQALDGFYAQQNPLPHQIKLRLAAGSSGGAVCAAILGVSINRQFDPVAATQVNLVQGAGAPVNNMFWNVWVNQLSLLPMLDPADLQTEIQDPTPPAPPPPPTPPPVPKAPPVQHAPAFLNATPINDAVTMVVSYATQSAPAYLVRRWAAAPFHVATTLCNLRGIPYTVSAVPSIGDFSGAAYIEHDDFAWFALPNTLDGTDGAIAQRLANEFWLSLNPQPDTSFSYQTLGDFACASGSMPLGLPARPLSRPAEHYLYRPAARVDDNGAVVTDWPVPDWIELPDVLAGSPYGFTAVDGGTLNNDPVKIAHDKLAGIGQHNPQGPAAANRALLMIDPLASQPSQVPPVGLSLVAVAKALEPTFVGGARYLTSDMALFQNADVFSRFQLVPNRLGFDGQPVDADLAPRNGAGNPLVGDVALAGSDLFALGGWCAREFRVHDFLLGRMNMAAYLRRELILRGDNPLFAQWTPAQIADFALQENGDRIAGPIGTPNSYYLPVIPLPPNNFGVYLPQWPVNAFDPSSLTGPLTSRVEAVLKVLRQDNVHGFWGWLGQMLALGTIAGMITESIIADFTTALSGRGLWHTPAG